MSAGHPSLDPIAPRCNPLRFGASLRMTSNLVLYLLPGGAIEFTRR